MEDSNHTSGAQTSCSQRCTMEVELQPTSDTTTTITTDEGSQKTGGGRITQQSSSSSCFQRRGGGTRFFFPLVVVAGMLCIGLYQTKHSINQQRSTSLSSNTMVYEEEKNLSIVQIKAAYEEQQHKQQHELELTEEEHEKRGIVFVRVGQAGGSTITNTFPRLACRHNRQNIISPTKLRNCLQKHLKEESPLSSQLELEMYVDKGKPPRDLEDYTTFMFPLRNPLTRAISSYSIFHHENTDKIWVHNGHHLEKQFYKFCFPTLTHLLSSIEYMFNPQMALLYRGKPINEIPTEYSDYCQQMAYVVVRGYNNPLVDRINPHLHRNHRFYYDETIRLFPDKDVVVIRTEHMHEDLKALDVAMGGKDDQFDYQQWKRNPGLSWKSSVMPTPKQFRDLCCILWEDIESYQDIVARASNLDFNSKLKSVKDVWDTCGINSREKTKFQVKDGRTANIAVTSAAGHRAQELLLFSWYEWHQASCPSSKSWERRKIDLTSPPPAGLVPNS